MNQRTNILNILQELLGEDLNVSLLVSCFRKSVLMILVLIVVFFSGIYLYLRYTLPVYEATANIVFKPESTENKIMGIEGVILPGTDDQSRELQFLKSKMLVERIVNKLDLKVSYYVEGRTRFVNTEVYNANPIKVSIIKIKNSDIIGEDIEFNFIDNSSFEFSYNYKTKKVAERHTYGEIIENKYFIIKIEKSSDYNNLVKDLNKLKYYFKINNIDKVINNIVRDLTIKPEATSTKILYKSNNSAYCYDIINTTVNEFIQLNKERKSQSIQQIINFLAAKIDTYRIEMNLYQDSLQDLLIKYRFNDSEDMIDKLGLNLSLLENSKDSLMFNLKIHQSFENYLESVKDIRLISIGMVDEELASYSMFVGKIKALEDEKELLLLKVTPEHPKIKIIEKEEEEARQELKQSISLNKLKIQQKLSGIEAKLNELYGLLSIIPEIQTTYYRLNRKYKQLEEYYNTLLEKFADYSIAKEGIVSDYTMFEKPLVPNTPISPDKIKIWSISIVVLILLSIIIVIVRYFLHSTIISVDEIRRKTKATFLGVVPTVNEVSPDKPIVVNNNQKSMVSEAFRTIRANLQFLDTSNKAGAKIIALTSSISGEGKTFISINVSGIFALLDKKVVLLDFDMRRPRLNKIFKTTNEVGVSTLMIGKSTVQECLMDTEIPNLKIITSGPIPPNPAELILSDNLDLVIEELKKTFDYIIIDTPPIGLVTDGLELIKRADFPVYVYRADYSDKAFISNLDKLINENKVQHLSYILNDIGRGVSGYYYDKSYSYSYTYGYGYGTGYYVEDKKPKKQSLFSKLFSKQKT